MNKGENAIIILVIVAVLAVYGLWSMRNNPISTVNYNQPIPFVGYTNNNPINIINYMPTAGYEQALLEYKNARIQLDKNCQATPNYVTYKNDTNIMIDNRSAIARTVKVGSVYTIEPYGFKIIKLLSPILPVTWFINCDNSPNVATILLQK